MLIRSATLADAMAVAHLHAASWRIAYRGMLRDEYLDGDIIPERERVWKERFRNPLPNQQVFVAEEQNKIIGFVCAFGGEDQRWGTFIDNLHVAPDLKRKKIGAQLMAAVADWCATAYPPRGLYLWVVEVNEPARRFYDRMGGINVEKDLWHPPGGGELVKFRYVWEDLTVLMNWKNAHSAA
jgi:GNAT superfamily N-acetyltransferase